MGLEAINSNLKQAAQLTLSLNYQEYVNKRPEPCSCCGRAPIRWGNKFKVRQAGDKVWVTTKNLDGKGAFPIPKKELTEDEEKALLKNDPTPLVTNPKLLRNYLINGYLAESYKNIVGCFTTRYRHETLDCPNVIDVRFGPPGALSKWLYPLSRSLFILGETPHTMPKVYPEGGLTYAPIWRSLDGNLGEDEKRLHLINVVGRGRYARSYHQIEIDWSQEVGEIALVAQVSNPEGNLDPETISWLEKEANYSPTLAFKV